MILLFLRLQVADVVLFEVDAHPVERSAKPIALSFEIVVGDRHRQISAHVEGHRLDLTVERKRGSPYLRQALWQAASMAVLYDPQLKAYYQRKKAEGKHHGTAIGAVCRKLVARIYIILKENRPYEIRY